MSAVTQNNYTGNGSTTTYSFTFPYLKTSDIKASLDGVDTTAFTLPNATTIQFNTAPSNGVQIKIFRETGVDNLTATFYAGSAIKSEDLNDNFTQNLYKTQEVGQRALSTLGGTMTGTLNMGEDTTIVFEGATDNAHETTLTVTDPTADRTITLPNVTGTVVTTGDTGTVTSTMITDGTIVNADVNTSAAIEGSKLQVSSGSNAGTMSAANFTKLAGIETAATADQTNAEIKTAYEANSNTNAYTDTEKTFVNAITATATELNILDGVTATTAELNLVDGVTATTAEINYVDGVTSNIQTQLDAKQPLDADLTTLAGMQSGTASKLADSTALTADIADLNQIDGLTKQTTISDTDASFPTSGAVVDYVTGQIDDIGGFEAITNETQFPNTQPVAGVAVSIADAGGIVVNSSGTSTTGRTVGGTTVTINNINSQFNSSTIATGIRFLVTSTGSGQVYNYHKATLPESDLVNLSGDINDFSERYRVGSSNPTSSLDSGDLFFNTSTGKLLVYNGTNTAWEEAQSIGNFFISTLSPAFNGSVQDFTLTNAPTSAQQVILSINGVVQKPNAGTSTPSEGFALSGSTIKLSAAPATGSTYHAVVMGSTVNIGTPSNNTVTNAILQNLSVSTGKIQDQAVTLDKLPHGTGSTDGKFLRANNGADPTFETVDLANLSASNLTSGTIPDARFPSTLPAISGANLTGVSSPEVYGFNTNGSGNLIVTTTNSGADNISGTTFDTFEDVVLAATGFSFSVNANGKLIATI